MTTTKTTHHNPARAAHLSAVRAWTPLPPGSNHCELVAGLPCPNRRETPMGYFPCHTQPHAHYGWNGS